MDVSGCTALEVALLMLDSRLAGNEYKCAQIYTSTLKQDCVGNEFFSARVCDIFIEWCGLAKVVDFLPNAEALKNSDEVVPSWILARIL